VVEFDVRYLLQQQDTAEGNLEFLPHKILSLDGGGTAILFDKLTAAN
jgi:hypothetical protein